MRHDEYGYPCARKIWHWWPIDIEYVSDSFSIWRQIRQGWKALTWIGRLRRYRDYGYKCPEAMRVHRAAMLRPWHGWPIGDSMVHYGRTYHFGRLKVYFGRRG